MPYNLWQSEILGKMKWQLVRKNLKMRCNAGQPA